MRRGSWPSAINSRAMMRRRAGFQPDEARRNPRKESQDLAASQPLAHYYAACLIDLEDVLCQIKTDCCNIAHGWLPLVVIFDDHHFGTSMPSGGHPPHQLAILLKDHCAVRFDEYRR
jgi:hypothetical protein